MKHYLMVAHGGSSNQILHEFEAKNYKEATSVADAIWRDKFLGSGCGNRYELFVSVSNEKTECKFDPSMTPGALVDRLEAIVHKEGPLSAEELLDRLEKTVVTPECLSRDEVSLEDIDNFPRARQEHLRNCHHCQDLWVFSRPDPKKAKAFAVLAAKHWQQKR